MDVYEDAGHAFFADYRPSYRPGPAAELWARVVPFLARHLQDALSALGAHPAGAAERRSYSALRQPRERRAARRTTVERKWWTLIAVSVAIFMLLLDITVVNVALPDIQRSLHSSFQDLQWVVDAYSLTLAAFLLTAGALADLLGRRRVFVAGLVVFTRLLGRLRPVRRAR